MMLNTSTEQIVKDLKLEQSSPEEVEEVISAMREHFGKIVTRIMLARLTPDQFERFKKILVIGDEVEQESQLAVLASEIPGLAEEIDQRIAEEYALMKAAVQ
jgi:hypothetical protein